MLILSIKETYTLRDFVENNIVFIAVVVIVVILGLILDIWLVGSPLHFKQILLNLYTNAMKYNKPNGLLYTKVEEYSRADKMIALKLTVKDTGIGMTKQFIEKELFAPFAQGENGVRTKVKGSGLGMSIVKKLFRK